MDRLAHTPQHILVTGAAGYIGSALVGELLRQGHRVLAVDSMIFGQRPLRAFMAHPRFKVHRLDTRGLMRGHLQGIDTVIDLAGLSSELAAELQPTWTDAVNHRAQVRLAHLARDSGVSRYLLISSCTVYGNAQAPECHEDTPTAPLTCHAKASAQAESAIFTLAQPHFAPIALRLGVVFGWSERMRFDLPIHAMVLSAKRLRRITLDEGGHRVRGHVHLRDAIHGIMVAMSAPLAVTAAQSFNISHHNLSSADIANIIRDVLGHHIEICPHGATAELNHHRPSIAKASHMLGYTPSGSILSGVHELLSALDQGDIAHSPQSDAQRWVLEVLAQGREATAAVERTAVNSGRLRAATLGTNTYAVPQRYPLQ